MIERAENETEPQDQVLLARGLAAKGAALVNAGRSREGIEVLDELASRLKDPPEPQLRALLALSLMNKSLALGQLARHDELEAVQQDMVNRFGEDALQLVEMHAGHCASTAGTPAREQLAAMLYSKAWMLAALDRTQEALV
jgi:NAD(P)-dependent dehydrogenase (short-subunit alcohol dehydrogenase family)